MTRKSAIIIYAIEIILVALTFALGSILERSIVTNFGYVSLVLVALSAAFGCFFPDWEDDICY